MDYVGPALGALLFLAVISLVAEPTRHTLNTIILAGCERCVLEWRIWSVGIGLPRHWNGDRVSCATVVFGLFVATSARRQRLPALVDLHGLHRSHAREQDDRRLLLFPCARRPSARCWRRRSKTCRRETDTSSVRRRRCSNSPTTCQTRRRSSASDRGSVAVRTHRAPT